MIAYVFWHSPKMDVVLEKYERAHRAFLEALCDAPPEGLRRATAFRIQPVPWISSKTQAYEDWYELDDSAALDRLNQAAVTGSTGQVHDRVAPMSATGTAGLYRHRLGDSSSAPPVVTHWFSKPQGVTYRDLEGALADACGRPGVRLWGRQMVLGPTPELCLRAAAPMDGTYPGLTVELSVVFDRACS